VFARLGSIINIENADFESNVGEQSAITAVVGVTMHVQSSNFVNNKSLIGAAAIYCEHNSFMNVESSTFSSNENPNGGAILANDGATVNVANSNFNNNYATHYGGAISGSLQAYINVANSNFIGNTAGVSLNVSIVNCFHALSMAFFSIFLHFFSFLIQFHIPSVVRWSNLDRPKNCSYSQYCCLPI